MLEEDVKRTNVDAGDFHITESKRCNRNKCLEPERVTLDLNLTPQQILHKNKFF